MRTAPKAQAPFSRLRWDLNKFARRGRIAIWSKLYRDDNPDTRRSIMVAGTARSGSTWLADIIASQLSARIMFEPFNPELVADYAQFNYLQYMRPGQEDAALQEVVGRVLSGRIRHPWIDRQVETLRPQWRIIKEVRACLFLRWIHDHFPEVPLLFIIRHPCAYVASMSRLHWAAEHDLESMLGQQALLEDHLADKLELINRAGSAVEKHAIVWCISNLVALRQFSDAPLHVVFYENLCQFPREEIPRLFRAIGRPYGDSVFKFARRPSTTSRRQSAIVGNADPVAPWRRDLADDTIAGVLGIVAEFGLGHLYGAADLPLLKASNPRELLYGR